MPGARDGREPLPRSFEEKKTPGEKLLVEKEVRNADGNPQYWCVRDHLQELRHALLFSSFYHDWWQMVKKVDNATQSAG